MAIKYRQELGRPLTYAEGDENFRTLEDSIEKTLAEYPTLTAAMADDIPDGVVFIVNDGDDAGYWRRDSSLSSGAEFIRAFPATEQQIADIVDDLHNQVDVELAGIRSDNAAFKSDVNQDLQQITAEKQAFESEAQDIKDALANMTTTGKIYDSLADAIAENPKPEDGTPFSVMGDGDNDGYYKFDSTQPDGVKFGRKFDRRIQVESISQLKNYKGRNGEAVDVLGYYEKGDGGGGTFYWDAASAEEDNGGTIIESSGVVNGRWKRRFSGYVNVKWFGAKNSEGADSTQAIQAAIDFIEAGGSGFVAGAGGSVYMPSGTYKVNTPVKVKKQVYLFGEGKSSTVITGNRSFSVLQTEGGDWQISDMCIRGGDVGVEMLSNSRRGLIEGCRIDLNRVGIKTTDGYINTIKRNDIVFNSCGIIVTGRSFQLNIHTNVIDNNVNSYNSGPAGCGIYVSGSAGISVKGNTIEGNRNNGSFDGLEAGAYGVGVFITGFSQRVLLSDNWYEYNGRYGSHIFLKGNDAANSNLRDSLEEYVLPVEHNPLGGSVPAGITIENSFFYLDSKYSMFCDASYLSYDALSIENCTLSVAPSTGDIESEPFVFVNSNRGSVEISNNILLNSGSYPENVRQGVKNTVVYSYDTGNDFSVIIDGEDWRVVTKTFDEVLKMGSGIVSDFQIPSSGQAHYLQNIRYSPTATGITIYEDGGVGPRIFASDLDEDQKKYLIPIAKNGTIARTRGNGSQFASSTNDHKGFIVRNHNVDDPGISDTIYARGDNSEYIGFIFLSEDEYNDIFRGANRLHIPDLELIGVEETATGPNTSLRRYFSQGDRLINSNPLAGENVGWVCVESGAPGTWEPFGLISGAEGTTGTYTSQDGKTVTVENGIITSIE